MIRFRIFIFAVFLDAAFMTVAYAAHDTSRIYVTKRQFDSDSAQYSCKCRVQEKAGIFWSDFRFEASGELRVKAKGFKQHWPAGSLYGFYMNRIRYVFVPSEKKYLAILNNKLVVPLFVKEIMSVGYRYVLLNGLIVYLSPKNGMAVELTKKNLYRDFAPGTKLLDEMLRLDAKLETYKDYISKRNFFKCQKLTMEAP
jgi:hypothetical protein